MLTTYPNSFKLVGIDKYDGKRTPQQWLRSYSTDIEVADSNNNMTVIYFPMALDPNLLTWLQSLPPKSIDSWDDLKKAFVDNFQGSLDHARNRHDLA